jgi:prolyl-tRNA editing enzyme YbaK/EbsC (Cys-tRNA(Pro) deacylase)
MDQLCFEPILQHQNLVSSSVYQAVSDWNGSTLATEFLVAEIDPAFAGGKELCEHYGVDPTEGANCIIVDAIRGEFIQTAACLVPVGLRADLNGVVRKALNARRVSLAPLDRVLAETHMEYGSITPIGLPPTWTILVDASFMNKPRMIVGGGLRHSKMSFPVSVLRELSNGQIIEHLGKIFEAADSSS